MRLPLPLAVAITIGREVLRALAVPLHVLAYLPRASHWRRRAAKALAASASVADRDELGGFLALHPPPHGRRGHVFVSCGEASGETHALHLVEAVNAACAQRTDRARPRWTAFGGGRLSALGVDVRFPLSEHAVMGLGGVLRSIPIIIRAFATFLRMLREDPPDLIVLIDYPGLHLVMAEAARRQRVPVVHYVAPQYWAWGPWRMTRYRRAIAGTLTILPFEPAFFAGEGLASEYVGHPLLDEVAGRPPDPAAVASVRARQTLVLMPGSRRHEIDEHLAPMVAAARRLADQRRGLRIVIPHRDPARAELIRTALATLPGHDEIEVIAGDPGVWLAGARAALVKSGTGSLEACLHGVPTVVVYTVRGAFARFVYHRMLTVPFFASANLCMHRRIVPELAIEREDQWRDVEAQLASLLDETTARASCIADLAALRTRLGQPGASARAARWVLPFCPAETTR